MLRYAADRRTLGFVAAYFGLVVYTWVWAPDAWWARLPLFLATCALAFIGAVITHNTVHCPAFHSKPANKLFQVVLTLTYGHPVSSYVPGHNMSHHKHTQSRMDVMRTTKTRSRWNLLNLLFFMPRVSGSILKGDFAFTKAMRTRRPRWFRQLALEGVVFLAVSVALVCIDFWGWLFIWQLPHMYAGWGIITMNLLQHDGCDESSQYNHSRNFVGKWLNWWVLNNGYHSIHHHTPGLHWSLAAAAHAEQIRPHIHRNLEQPSLLAYLWKTFGWPGTRTRYDGTPIELPEAGTDASWIPEEIPVDVSLGAEA
jgi:fatty acid desaturase